MSPTPTNHETQLAQVLQAGFDCHVKDDTLAVGSIPYRLSDGGIGQGFIVCHLNRDGENISTPQDHTVTWAAAEVPHLRTGQPMDGLIINRDCIAWSNGITTICTMSRPGPDSYRSYGAKLLPYVRMIAQEAVDRWRNTASAGVVYLEDVNSMADHETGLDRVGAGYLNELLAKEIVAVIGAGGTGGHIVDLVSKCSVKQIDIYDPDHVSQHTQIRWPGVVERCFMDGKTNKAEYLATCHSKRTNRNVRGHPFAIDESNMTYLKQKTMVFVAIDNGEARRKILTNLADMGVNFIDCGIDMQTDGDALAASARIVRCQGERSSDKRMELAERTPGQAVAVEDDPYTRNIQTGEMNGLNAALAVIAWKQGIGFYKDVHRYRRSRMHMTTNMWALYDPKEVAVS